MFVISTGLSACSESAATISDESTGIISQSPVAASTQPTIDALSVEETNPQAEVITQAPQPEGKLEILEHRLVKKDSTIAVVGTAINAGASVITYSEVIARFFNAQGTLIEVQDCMLCGGPVLTEWRDMKIESLDPGGKWDFEIVFLAQGSETIDSYEIYVGAIR